MLIPLDLLCISVPDQLRMWGRHQSQLEAFSCLAKSGESSAFNCNIHSFSSLYDQWLLRYQHVTAEVFTFVEDIKLVVVRNHWALPETQEIFYLLAESRVLRFSSESTSVRKPKSALKMSTKMKWISHKPTTSNRMLCDQPRSCVDLYW